MQAISTLKEIHAHGIQTAKDLASVVILDIPFVIGRYAAQGDVNFTFLPKVPDAAIAAKPVSQLAPGNTRGSRHCIRQEDMKHVQFFRLPNPNPLEGLILLFDEETVIEHPEHKHHRYPKGAIVAVTFQRRYADELRRIED